MALLMGAVISPTDPIVSTTIVTGELAEKNIPDDVRHTISAESGANDGLAYPLVLLPILLIKEPLHALWAEWIFKVVLWETLGAIILGILLGIGFGHLLIWAESKKTVETTSFLAQTLALTLLSLGLGELLRIDGILAVFSAGISFDYIVGAGERAQEENVQEAVNMFFTLPVFVLLGLVLPLREWFALGWQGLLFCGAVLLLRRLPALLVIYRWIPTLRKRTDAVFTGWFGPIGVAALLYTTMALKSTANEQIWVLGTLAITSSIFVHGISAAPFTKMYAVRQKNEQNRSVSS
jgi:NhaP-type Na+/H+ or K+/H+ antiporter